MCFEKLVFQLGFQPSDLPSFTVIRYGAASGIAGRPRKIEVRSQFPGICNLGPSMMKSVISTPGLDSSQRISSTQSSFHCSSLLLRPKVDIPVRIQRPSKSQRLGVPCHLCGVPQRLVFGQTCTKSSFHGVPDPPTRGPGDPRGPHLLRHWKL